MSSRAKVLVVTNESRRDARVQDALETDEFPTAAFRLTEPLELGGGAADGEAVSVNAVEAPTAPVVLSISDDFTLELQVLLVRS